MAKLPYLLRLGAAVALIGFLALFSVATSPHDPLRKRLSLLFKHAPLCALENAGMLPLRRAHYTIELGTIDVLYCTPAEPPRYVGRPLAHSIVAVSDFGRVVQRFDRAGVLLWQTRLYTPRGLDIANDVVYVGDLHDVVVLDAATGKELRRYPLGDFVLSIKVQGNIMLVGHDMDGTGALALYRIDGRQATLVKRYEQAFSYPRGVDIEAGKLVVADTFGHRIVQLSFGSGVLEAEVPAFFPNSVQVRDGQVLVTEEHLNMLTVLAAGDLSWAGVGGGCAGALPADGAALLVKRGVRRSPPAYCAPEMRLFSPNDAVRAGAFLFVADTDHHRVLVLKNGSVWGQWSGFNDPVNVRVMPE